MTRILSRAAILRLRDALSPEYMLRLGNRFARQPRDPDYPFIVFLTDVVAEVTYRAACGEPDDNWNALAYRYDLEECDYCTILAALMKQGWSPSVVRW